MIPMWPEVCKPMRNINDAQVHESGIEQVQEFIKANPNSSSTYRRSAACRSSQGMLREQRHYELRRD